MFTGKVCSHEIIFVGSSKMLWLPRSNLDRPPIVKNASDVHCTRGSLNCLNWTVKEWAVPKSDSGRSKQPTFWCVVSFGSYWSNRCTRVKKSLQDDCLVRIWIETRLEFLNYFYFLNIICNLDHKDQPKKRKKCSNISTKVSNF